MASCAVLGAPTPASPARPGEEIRINGMTFVSSDSSGRDWVVWADRARFGIGRETVELEGVTIRFDDPSEPIELTIRCAKAEVALESESFRLQGDVKGTDADGRTFTTEWLEFDGASRVLNTSAAVELIDAGAVYRGRGLRYDVGARRLRLIDGASMTRRRSDR